MPHNGNEIAMAGFRETLAIWWQMTGTLFWRHSPPPILGGVVPVDRPEQLSKESDKFVQKTQELENELRRHGIITRRIMRR